MGIEIEMEKTTNRQSRAKREPEVDKESHNQTRRERQRQVG